MKRWLCCLMLLAALTVPAGAVELPEELTVSALMPMGYPAENAVPSGNHTKFRPFEETVQFI